MIQLYLTDVGCEVERLARIEHGVVQILFIVCADHLAAAPSQIEPIAQSGILIS